MKFHVLSDLHLEHDEPFTPPPTDADVVLLAGDIASGTNAVAWAADSFPGKQVVVLGGNHDAYGWEMASWHAAMIGAAREVAPHVHVLTPGGVTFVNPGEQPVRVLGATLWTDFAIYGESRASQHARLVEQFLVDYRAIRVGDRKLKWEDTLEWHRRELAWLKSECRAARARGEKVVVVTHHGPSLRSAHARYKNDAVTSGFLSNLEAFAAEYVDCWAHGHVHNSASYHLGDCRVVVNPRGYPLHRYSTHTVFENPDFDAALVVEV
jgi:predicted phosphodiesterase